MTLRTNLHLEPDDVTDVSDIVPWHSWCDIDYCKLCGAGPSTLSFEFSYLLNGNTVAHYVSEACAACTRLLAQRDPLYCSRDYWAKNVASGKNNYRVYRQYGLIDDFAL